jgi:hypothetical protein
VSTAATGRVTLIAALTGAAVVGCGGGHEGEGSGAPATTTTGRAPAALYHATSAYGYRFAQPPIVVVEPAAAYHLYLRLNRRLPAHGDRTRAGADVEGAVGGTPLGPTSFGHDDRPCYAQTLDLLERVRRSPADAGVGTPVTVKLFIDGRPRPLTAVVGVSPVRKVRDPPPTVAVDPAEPYLARIGCARQHAPSVAAAG